MHEAKETALLVAVGILGYVAALEVGAPDVAAGLFLVGVGVVAPVLRREAGRRDAGERNRQDAGERRRRDA